MKASLARRLEALEQGSGPLIDDLADYVRWYAEGCPSDWLWDPRFEMQMEELAKTISHNED